MATVKIIIDDPEPQVRGDLVEHIPDVAIIAQSAAICDGDIFKDHLFGIIRKYLHDNDNQVRQTAEAALMVLIERGLIDNEMIERDIWPIIELLSHMPADFLISSASLMSKMAPLVGRELTEKLFLNRYLSLCKTNAFYVRKVCATHFGDICAAVGRKTFFYRLFPTFVQLCCDSCWEVRKACVDVMMPVSCFLTIHHRRAMLSQLLACRLNDDSKWVKMSAFQILGPFISTLAKQCTELTYNQYGELVLTNQQGARFSIHYSYEGIFAPKFSIRSQINDEEEDDDIEINSFVTNAKQDATWDFLYSHGEAELEKMKKKYERFQNRDQFLEQQNEGRDWSNSGDETEKYNPFLYYYIPPDLPLDEKLVEAAKESLILNSSEEQSNDKSLEENEEGIDDDGSFQKRKLNTIEEEQKRNRKSDSNLSMEELYQEFNALTPTEENGGSGGDNNNPSTGVKGTEDDVEHEKSRLKLHSRRRKFSKPKKNNVMRSNFPYDEKKEEQDSFLNNIVDYKNTQCTDISIDKSNLDSSVTSNSNQNEEGDNVSDIVPMVLIEYFVSMAEPKQFLEFNSDFAHHCAFSFPAVTLTLGKENWGLLKKAYQSLAGDRQWKVRRTIASSIHEIAMILGEELTATDLLPIYEGFIKDLDEVRIGILKNLATFLKILRPSDRCQYLPILHNFLVTDNERNWRFRQELATQLLEAITLFSPNDVAQNIAPLALQLLIDKIAAVRKVALTLVTRVLYHLSTDNALMIALIHELRDTLAVDVKNWIRRQTYALLCAQLIEDANMIEEILIEEMLPDLLNLAWDAVPNVRLVVARTLRPPSNSSLLHLYSRLEFEDVRKIRKHLRMDPDRDVRIRAGGNEELNVEEKTDSTRNLYFK